MYIPSSPLKKSWEAVSTRTLRQLCLTLLTPGEALLSVGKAREDKHAGQSLPRGFTGCIDRGRNDRPAKAEIICQVPRRVTSRSQDT